MLLISFNAFFVDEIASLKSEWTVSAKLMLGKVGSKLVGYNAGISIRLFNELANESKWPLKLGISGWYKFDVYELKPNKSVGGIRSSINENGLLLVFKIVVGSPLIRGRIEFPSKVTGNSMPGRIGSGNTVGWVICSNGSTGTIGG